MRPLLLLATPRTVSTAFDKMMRGRGDHQVLTEPFSHAWYHGPERVSDRFGLERPEAGFTAVLDQVMARAGAGPVFVKDMAYHLGPMLRSDVLALFRVTLVTRDPRRAVPSMLRRWPDATDVELGYAALDRVADLAPDAVVLDADELCRRPAEVVARWCAAMGIEHRDEWLTWRPGMPDDWEPWAEWFAAAARSTRFTPPSPDPPEVDAATAARIAACLPVHERLAARALR